MTYAITNRVYPFLRQNISNQIYDMSSYECEIPENVTKEPGSTKYHDFLNLIL